MKTRYDGLRDAGKACITQSIIQKRGCRGRCAPAGEATWGGKGGEEEKEIAQAAA